MLDLVSAMQCATSTHSCQLTAYFFNLFRNIRKAAPVVCTHCVYQCGEGEGYKLISPVNICTFGHHRSALRLYLDHAISLSL